MNRVEQIRAEVLAKMEAKRAQYNETKEIANLERQLNNADLVFKLEDIATTTAKLKELEQSCELIVASMPIYSSKTRENRKFNPSRQYGLGNHIQLLSGLLTGIMYSAQEHKALMLAETKLSEDLVEQTVEAFGAPAYYSTNYNEVVPEVPYNVATLQANLGIVAETLGIDLDVSKITPQGMQHRFNVALLRANRELSERQTAIDLGSQTITVEA